MHQSWTTVRSLALSVQGAISQDPTDPTKFFQDQNDPTKVFLVLNTRGRDLCQIVSDRMVTSMLCPTLLSFSFVLSLQDLFSIGAIAAFIWLVYSAYGEIAKLK